MKKILQISSLFLFLFFAQSVYAVGEICDADVAPCLDLPDASVCTAPPIIENAGGCPSGYAWISNAGAAGTGECAIPNVCASDTDEFHCSTNTCWKQPIPGPSATCSQADVNTGSSLPCCTDGQLATRDASYPTGWKCEDKPVIPVIPVSLRDSVDGIIDFLDALMTELGVDVGNITDIVTALTNLADGGSLDQITAYKADLAAALAAFAIPPASDDVVWAGVTSTSHDGKYTNGYADADALCASNYALSRVCSVEDIMTLRHKGELPGSVGGDEKAWINGGPPGFNSASNDCAGWKINDTTANNAWGRYWWFGLNQGWADGCNLTHRFACCN